VLGSMNMDLVASVDQAPTPGQTVTGHRFLQVPGGKGANQAIAASLAGADVTMLGSVGSDAYGDEILRLLATLGVGVDAVTRADEATGTAHVVVDSAGSNSIIVIPGANGTLTALEDRHRDLIAQSDALLLQLELPLSIVEQAAAYAHSLGVLVVLTPAPVRPLRESLFAQVDLLVPNEGESLELTGAATADAAAQILSARARSVVVTLGERGCLYLGPEGRIRAEARRVRAVDTTAAGDTFVGALCARLIEGTPVARALDWASAAAALSVQRWGASSSMPSRSEVDALIGPL
jgi:ribokinase